MRVDRILAEERPVFSFEFFPPKTDEARRTLDGTLGVLKDDRPDDVAVTYGRVAATGERGSCTPCREPDPSRHAR